MHRAFGVIILQLVMKKTETASINTQYVAWELPTQKGGDIIIGMLFLSLTLLLTIVCHSADINTNNTEAYRAASRQQVLNARLALEEQRSRLTREYLNSPISTIVHSTKQERENLSLIHISEPTRPY